VATRTAVGRADRLVTTTQTRSGDAAGEGADEVDHFPGEPDIWLFVVFETLVFTSYFAIYLYSRTQHEQAFLEAQSALTLWLGIIETILLLTSSWAIARCVLHTRDGRYDAARQAAVVTTGLGTTFLALKVVEWVHLIRGGHTFTSSDFMQHFFFLTGIHAVHLLFGFLVLGVIIHQLSDRQRCSRRVIETCSTYWHTIDLFWVVIFAMLYIVR
jgi:nitric oxide reductase NorE protein